MEGLVAAPAPPSYLLPGDGKKAPRQHSAAALSDPENVTDILPGQETWHILNLPDILYTFKSPQKRRRKYPPVPMKPNPRPGGPPLRSFNILPDRISNNVEEFRVEAWMRHDPRIQLGDIRDRMPVGRQLKNNALQQRSVRFRRAFNLLAWGTCNNKTKSTEAQMERMLRKRGIDPRANSTRGLTPGLIYPALGEAGGRIPLPESFARRYGYLPAEPRSSKNSSKAKKGSKKMDSSEDESEYNDDEEVDLVSDDTGDEYYLDEAQIRQYGGVADADDHGEDGEVEADVEVKIDANGNNGRAGNGQHPSIATNSPPCSSGLNIPGEAPRHPDADDFEAMMKRWLNEFEVEQPATNPRGTNQHPMAGAAAANGSTNPNSTANPTANANPGTNINAHVTNTNTNMVSNGNASADSGGTYIVNAPAPTHIKEEPHPSPDPEADNQTPEPSGATPSDHEDTPSPQDDDYENETYPRGQKRRRYEDEESEYEDDGSESSSDNSDDDRDEDCSSNSSYGRARKRPALMEREPSEDQQSNVSSFVEDILDDDILGTMEDQDDHQAPAEEYDPNNPTYEDLLGIYGGDYVDDNMDRMPQPFLVSDSPLPRTQYVDVQAQHAAAFARIADTIKLLFGEPMASNWEKWAFEGV